MAAVRLRPVAEVDGATDGELVRAGAEGAPEAFAELYRRHAPAAVGVARAALGNDDDAADAVAEAFAKVVGIISAGRFPAGAEFRPYLVVTVRNAAVDQLRRAGRLAPVADLAELEPDSPRRGPSDSIVASEESELVAQAFRDLPRRWQSVLWLTEVEGVPPREAAEILGLSPNNVSQLATRARARLRERFLQAHVGNHARPGCQATVDRLGAYLAGTLPAGARHAVDAHLAGCDPCRGRLAEVEDVGAALRRAALPVPVLAELARRLAGGRERRRQRGADDQPETAVAGPPATVATSVSARVAASAPAVQTVATSPVAAMVPVIAAEPVARVVGRALAAVVAVVAALIPGGGDGDGRARAAAAPAPAPAPVATVAPTTVPPPPTTIPAPPPAEPAVIAPAPPPPPPPEPGPLPDTNHPHSTVAQAVGPAVGIYDAPEGAYLGDLYNPLPSGAERVFLVTRAWEDWYEVLLPVRPNQRKGWVRRSEVSISSHSYSIVIELGVHRLTVFEGEAPIQVERIGVGKANTPTPGGLYYTKELIEIVDGAGRLYPHGPYGPFAFGLSGFSEVFRSFGDGGDGTVGIHGTNDPSSLGRDVSAGCIRMRNEAVTRLAGFLPLGVPVEIRP